MSNTNDAGTEGLQWPNKEHVLTNNLKCLKIAIVKNKIAGTSGCTTLRSTLLLKQMVLATVWSEVMQKQRF